jgi:hypothetical protein
MDSTGTTPEKMDTRVKLSTLWLVAMLTYTYGDVVTLMDPVKRGSMEMTQGFLLGASVFMTIPIAMVLLSRILSHRANRLVNIIAGSIMTAALILTLFVAVPAVHYVYFSVIEIALTAVIVVFASRWSGIEKVSTKAATAA